MGLFDKLKQGLTKTRESFSDRVDAVLRPLRRIDEDLFEELEEALITADIGVDTTLQILDELRACAKEQKISDAELLRTQLKRLIQERLSAGDTTLHLEQKPAVILVIGVNGVGKTTTIGKLAALLKQEGKRVLLAAGDTFRAAAIEQLDIWAKRAEVDMIRHQEGADPGAVIFDAVQAARARHADVLICDTAGRLHNKANLMNELHKLFRIIQKELPESSLEVLLVLDATTGQNALVQVREFSDAAGITGIVLTKLDGTAKGGVVVAIQAEQAIPVKLIGVGEGMEDLQYFNPQEFAEALF